MENENNQYIVNKDVLKSPVLIGLSQNYFFRFIIAIFIDIVFIPILVIITGNPTIVLFILITVLASYYFFLKLKQKKYGNYSNELKAYKAQEKQIFLDNANIFFEQSNP